MIRTLNNYKQNILELIKLSWPLIIGNLGVILVGVGDVYVAAKHSTETLAAVSIANAFLFTIFLFGIGILASISPLLSNYRGEKNNIKKYFIPTLIFSLILSIIAVILAIACIPLIDKMGFEKHLLTDIKEYMFICAFSTIGVYLFVGVKEYLQAFEIVMLPNIINFLGVALNLALNFIFVFGYYGFPEMGCKGLAWATLISRMVLALILILYCIVKLRIIIFNDNKYYAQLLKIGIPIAFAIFFENMAFNIITILAGRISGVFAAAENILLTMVNCTFMIPLAISNAIAIKVGYNNGAKNFVELKKYVIAGSMISLIFMMLTAIFYISIPNALVKIFTSDTQLIEICIPILLLIGIFQIFDGLQVSLGGAFKGMKKTNIVMIGDFAAYWLFGIPLGYYFAVGKNMNLYGFWIGITLSIAALGISFLIIMIKQLNMLNNFIKIDANKQKNCNISLVTHK